MVTRSSFEAKVLTAFTAAVVVVVVLALITWKLVDDAAQAASAVTRTHEVIDRVARTQGDTLQIEFTTQSFRISGDPARLAERNVAIDSREVALAAVKTLTADDAVQQERWKRLREVIDERLVISRHVELLRKTQGQEAASAFVASAPLKETRERSYRLLSEMENWERGLLARRSAEQVRAQQVMVATGSLFSFLLLVLLATTYELIRRQFRKTEASQRALRISEESLATTLLSIGDGVIATDTEGRLTRMNSVSEKLTGWRLVDAIGRPIEEVFRLVHEQTRAPALVPVAKVLETGEIQELSNHTVLIARDGSEHPISDSAAPIRDATGRLNGVVLVFRDVSAEREVQKAISNQSELLEQRVIERTAQLRASEQQLSRVLEGTDQGYWDWNLTTNTFQVSARWETMLGYAPGEMRVDTAHWPELVHPEDLPLALASIERHLSGHSANHEVEFRARTKDGGWRWILTRGRVVTRTDNGTPLMMSGTHTDVTQRRQLEQAQREAVAVFESSYEGIMVTNAEGLITKVNPAFTRITGYELSDVIERSPRMLSSGRHDPSFYQALWASLNEHDFWHGEIWNRRKTGELYATLQSISAIRDAYGQVLHYVSVFADITQIKEHEAELARVANYDALTDLPNRRLLSDRLTQTILRSERSGKLCVVCFLDLDGFKHINDQFGHTVGDQLLRGVAEHLKTILRPEDTLSRLGGDEFVLLLSEVKSLDECTLILDRVLETVNRPINAGGHVFNITVSIGVSFYPADHSYPDTLLRHADQAMYLAKQAGKNRYQMFDTEIDRKTQHHLEYFEEMQRALDRNEFVLHYQPQVDLVSGEVIGAEALIRWQHPERGLLPPSDFLPYLRGGIHEQLFGEWVIDTALNQIEAWLRGGLAMKVSVNISANHLLQANFSARLERALTLHGGVNPAYLELEVLETAAIGDMQAAVEILQRCKKLGVRFSLDDFGTGYSSLTYLRKLPLNTLKIDQSFVRDMLSDPNDLSIVRSVIELALAFDRRVIAEGVESLKHCVTLRSMGCRYAQGYGIAKPMAADEYPSWCMRWLQSEVWKQF
ncbi:MAG: EAL domain-containing protein [Rhodoferax sp.]|uniref:EAL domain-containing protein n=1 Tax=Rhodoferax sp. TaxID=50421 RepID=UPI00261943EA|nr:EAL domain-containing protein [Rhodoferax sp.]MDD2881109.1 EAL domain-containing protein [Rhodoferax sp.]